MIELKRLLLCAFCEKVVITTLLSQMHITNPGTMQYMYIHTDEQTAVVVIADDKISTIYLTRHQYFSYLKLFAANCQCL